MKTLTIPASEIRKGDVLLIGDSGRFNVVSNPRRVRVGGEIRVEVDVLDAFRSGPSRRRQFSPTKTITVKR